MEITQMSIIWWMDKQNVICPYTRLFDQTQKWSTDTSYNVDEPWKYYAKWKKTDKKTNILYESIYITLLEIANP